MHPPRVTPERSMTVVVEAIIAGVSRSVSVCARAGTVWEANCKVSQLRIPADTGAGRLGGRLLRADEKSLVEL